jgi:hypothetical protein
LNLDGTVDANFDLGGAIEREDGTAGDVRSLAVQGDGRILLGGYFSRVSGTAVNAMARLDRDGRVDPSFAAVGTDPEAPRNNVSSLAVEPGGAVLALGTFPILDASGQAQVARFATDGSFDSLLDLGTGPVLNSTWCLNCPGYLSSIAEFPDGSLLLGGSFTEFNGIPRAGLVRLHGDGAVNRPRIESVAALQDGSFKLIICGRSSWTYRIETSTDLVTWTLLDECPSAGAMTEFHEKAGAQSPVKFYRAIVK